MLAQPTRSHPEECTSAKGTTYGRSWAGKARLVAFRSAEPNERGRPVIQVLAEAPEPRPDQPRSERRETMR